LSNVLVFLVFISGLILVVKGGDYFVDAATCIAKALRVPTFIVGATIVSIATTLPEVLVSVIAAADGKIEMAVGNAVGSVIANTGLIMSIALIFMAIEARRIHYMNRGILFISAAAVLYLASDGGRLSIPGSFILLIICGLYIFENVRATKKHREPICECEVNFDKKGKIKYGLMFILGAAGIIIGSRMLVTSGSQIALMFNVSERVIAITIVAIGTSLPELVTTVSAIVKKEAGLSIGNIIGANIIDLTLILPICSLISREPLPVSLGTMNIDLPACLILTLIAMIPIFIKERGYKIQGVLMFVGYLFYLSVAIV